MGVGFSYCGIGEMIFRGGGFGTRGEVARCYGGCV